MVTTFHPSRSVSPYGSAPNTVHEYGDDDDGPYGTLLQIPLYPVAN